MFPPATNSVRIRREAANFTQAALAADCTVSRQSLAAIESGRAVPGVDLALRLASALDCRVEDLFALEQPVQRLRVVARTSGKPRNGMPETSRVALAHIHGRWVGSRLTGDQLHLSADALLESETSRHESHQADEFTTSPLRALDDARENLLLQGCASGLGLIADRLLARKGAGRCWWFTSSSSAALEALARGEVHIAGVHHEIDAHGDDNVEAVRRAAIPEPTLLVSFARWEAGILSRAGDTRVSGIDSLRDPLVRLVTREPGSGARELLMRSLRKAGISSDCLDGKALCATGHLDVARTIHLGLADMGIATRDAALAFGLHFTPLAEERYDLVIPRSIMEDAKVSRLLDTLTSLSGRRELASLGYEVTCSGSVVAEVEAA